MKRNSLFAIAALIANCFGGWACGKSNDNPSTTYFPPYTPTNTETAISTATSSQISTDAARPSDSALPTPTPTTSPDSAIVADVPVAAIATTVDANDGQTRTPDETTTRPLPFDAAMADSPISRDASIDTTAFPANCGHGHQLPCSNGKCVPGVRLGYVAVATGSRLPGNPVPANSTAATVRWCVPCKESMADYTSLSSYAAYPCSSFGIGDASSTALCNYYVTWATGGVAADQCDGVDNSCSGSLEELDILCSAATGYPGSQCVSKDPIKTAVAGYTLTLPINGCQCGASCAGKKCGDENGCGGYCKVACSSGQLCISTADKHASCVDEQCAGKACGDSNGYGGTCKGTCTDRRLACELVSGSYGCWCPDSSCAGKNCGETDSCSGGSCSGACPGGGACNYVAGKYQCVSGTQTVTSTATRTAIATSTGTGTGTGSTCHNENSCLNFTVGYDSGTGWLYGNATNNCSQNIWCMFYPNNGTARHGLTLNPGVTYGEISGGLYWPNATNAQFSCALPSDPISCFPPG